MNGRVRALRRRSRCAPVIGLASALSMAFLLAAQEIAPLDRVRASFLLEFPEFVEWPSAAWQASRTFQLCTAAPNPVEGALQDLIGDAQVRGRAVILRRLQGSDDPTLCHLLFVPRSRTDQLDIVRRTHGRPVLTVGDGDEFLTHGGVIQLRVVEGRVRFAINVANADVNGIRLRSQLLALATSIEGDPR
jgi:hypothetical protein